MKQQKSHLIAWCQKSNIKIIEDIGTYAAQYDYTKHKGETIKYSPLYTDTKIVYFLLHELGHRRLRLKNDCWQSTDEIINEPFDKLTEEIKAWHIGYSMTKIIGIKINYEGYRRFAAKCLRTYINKLFLEDKKEWRSIMNYRSNKRSYLKC